MVEVEEASGGKENANELLDCYLKNILILPILILDSTTYGQ